MLTWQSSGVECSGREWSAWVGERGGAAAPAPQGQAHQATEARDRVQEGQISGQSRTTFFMTFWAVLRIRIRIRIHRINMFLGPLNPDPLDRSMDPDPDPALNPDPDPSIIKKI